MQIDPKSRLLLVSNSTLHGRGYLDHVAEELGNFLGDAKRVVFVPFALKDWNAYGDKACGRLAQIGFEMESIHRASNPQNSLGDADAVFIGGGNTFRLLKKLYEYNLIEVIRERVSKGMGYIGSSAGSNVACPTIKTTNDMPIVQPPSFDALNLVPFQINPHYMDHDPKSTHMGETREERLIQFHEENNGPVVALREGALLRIENATVLLKGSTGARVFRQDHEPIEVTPGTYLDSLVVP